MSENVYYPPLPATMLPLSGGTLTGTVTSQNIIPAASTTYDIGTSTGLLYRNIYTRHIVSGGNTPAISGTGYGATGSISAETGSSDLSGIVTITAGNAGNAATGTVTITFSTVGGDYGINTPATVATLMSGGASWNARATIQATSITANFCTFTWDNNAVNLGVNSVYKVAYIIIGK